MNEFYFFCYLGWSLMLQTIVFKETKNVFSLKAVDWASPRGDPDVPSQPNLLK